jgi:hypothetical protein
LRNPVDAELHVLDLSQLASHVGSIAVEGSRGLSPQSDDAEAA